MAPVLEVSDLQTHFFTFGGTRVVKAVDRVSFALHEGETLGLVGESGSGKTTTCLSIVGLLPRAARIVGGSVLFEGDDLTRMSQRELRRIRGRRIAVILQDPMASLNPLFTIGDQIAEAVKRHQRLSGAQAAKRVVEMIKSVGIPSPERRVHEYPHQFSGGMRQRVMMAMALSCDPDLLIADEPTTALDVTIQAQIIELMIRLKNEMKMSILIITHDLGVVAEMADRVLVMYAGRVVESAPIALLLDSPVHPYTKGLLRCVPGLTDVEKRLHTIPGVVPDPAHLPRGCRFQPRCPHAFDPCSAGEPPLAPVRDRHLASCWLAAEGKR